MPLRSPEPRQDRVIQGATTTTTSAAKAASSILPDGHTREQPRYLWFRRNRWLSSTHGLIADIAIGSNYDGAAALGSKGRAWDAQLKTLPDQRELSLLLGRCATVWVDLARLSCTRVVHRDFEPPAF